MWLWKATHFNGQTTESGHHKNAGLVVEKDCHVRSHRRATVEQTAERVNASYNRKMSEHTVYITMAWSDESGFYLHMDCQVCMH